MADELMKSASFEGKKTFKLPAGAKVIKNSHTLRVKEIENGFIITKEYQLEYMPAGKDAYSRSEWYTKEWYSKDNPITIKVDSNDKDLINVL